MIYGNSVGGIGIERTYILVDESGNELTAVVSEEPVTLDAGANDIRIGKTAATVEGVTEGTKRIPSYQTLEGAKIVSNGSKLVLPIADYEYTKMQALICAFNTSLSDSVKTEKVAINDRVYEVNSTTSLAEIEIDADNKRIDFGITNNSGSQLIIRYFTYKEEY